MNQKPRFESARNSRTLVHASRALAFAFAVFAAICSTGCKDKATPAAENVPDARTLLTQATTAFQAGSEAVKGDERQRWLNEAAGHYEQLLKNHPSESNLCAQAFRGLGSIHATQGKTNEAIKLYATVGEKYPSQDWEVLMAWKSAADALWEMSRRDEAKTFYAKIVERFGKKDAPQIIQQVVRGSKTRLAE